MALNAPPPYTDITGISRAVMKDNAQETLANYNGNARPGELVVDLTQDPPPLYVGNNAGQLTLVASGGGGGLPLANGDSNFNIPVASGNVLIEVNDSYIWTFDVDGNLNIPNNIVGAGTITIDNSATGNSADIRLLAADDILLQGKNKPIGAGSEGGDININGGNGSPDDGEEGSGSGGDIVLLAGQGGLANVNTGGFGGFVRLRGGAGGDASTEADAGNGGYIEIFAGDAGGNSGNAERGNFGGYIEITAGDSTGNLAPGGDVTITSGAGGPNASAGQIELNVPPSDLGSGGTWSFNSDGDMIFPTNGQIVMDNGDGTIGNQGDDFVISWDNEELVLRSVAGDVDVESDTDFNIRVNYDGGAGDYLTKWIFTQNNDIVNITGNSSIVTEAGNLNLQGGRNTLSSGNVQITAVDNGVAVNTWTFANNGVLTAPGAMQLAVYANTTVRDSAITSPQPGMMIYVTGTGMQVRGATQWNTIAGSGT